MKKRYQNICEIPISSPKGSFQKFWDNKKLKGVKRINENLWFEQQQGLLLWMANTTRGRKLLCIPENFPKIIEISKKHITGHLRFEKVGENSYLHHKVSDFRVGAKWGNIIRHKWKEFQEYAQEYYFYVYTKPILFPVTPQSYYAYTTSTFYPDPDPETTTVDGVVIHNITGCVAGSLSLADLRDAAGTSAQATNPAGGTSFIRLRSDSATSDVYCQSTKGIFGFDTSAIPDADTVSAAVFSLAGQGDAESNGLTSNVNWGVVSSAAPATATDLVSGDYSKPSTTLVSGLVAVSAWVQTDGTYNDVTLTDLTVISKTGITWLATMCEALRSGTAEGSWNAGEFDDITSYFAEASGTTTDPKLVVTHAASVTSNFLNFFGPQPQV